MKYLAVFVMFMGALLGPAAFAQEATEEAPAAPRTHLDTAPDFSQIQLVQLPTGFDQPVYAFHAPGDTERLFIAEQAGRIWAVNATGERAPEPFLNIEALVSRTANERGLLGVAFHPDYTENGYLFVHYSARTPEDGMGVIARYTVSADDPNMIDPDSAQIILTQSQPYENHNGGQIAFGPDGYLYIGFGDGGSQGDPQNLAQSPDSLLGKILRIDVNGPELYGIPKDNPHNALSMEMRPEIWALGLRNPWRFSFDRATGDLYIADVGQNIVEEVNFQPADSPGGENYGWRVYEGTLLYAPNDPNTGDYVAPIAEYQHNRGCSITGGYVYRGQELPELDGVYFFADYCSGIIWASYRDANDAWQTQEIMDTEYLINSFGEDANGELYIVSHSGAVFRMTARP